MKQYAIWGPKYSEGLLNGPDLLFFIKLTGDRKLEVAGRLTHIALGGMPKEEVTTLTGPAAEVMFHTAVAAKTPTSAQKIYNNASKEESMKFLEEIAL